MANGGGNGKSIHIDRASGKVTINFRTLAYIITLAGVMIGASWTLTLFCDRNEARAAANDKRKFEDNFDRYYPAKHAPCSTRVSGLAARQRKFDYAILEIRAMMRATANQEQQAAARSFYRRDSISQREEIENIDEE